MQEAEQAATEIAQVEFEAAKAEQGFLTPRSTELALQAKQELDRRTSSECSSVLNRRGSSGASSSSTPCATSAQLSV